MSTPFGEVINGSSATAGHLIRKRDGRLANFDKGRIFRAIEAAFRAERNVAPGGSLEEVTLKHIDAVTNAVIHDILTTNASGEAVDVERIQDMVEVQLMKVGDFAVARRYILYREERYRERALRLQQEAARKPRPTVKRPDGSTVPLDLHQIKRTIYRACMDLENVEPEFLIEEVLAALFDGITQREVEMAQVLSARSRMEFDPDYGKVATRLLLNMVYEEVLGSLPAPSELVNASRQGFFRMIQDGIAAERISPELANFDLNRLFEAMRIERDQDFSYLGLQTIYDRYLIHIGGRRIETPQFFWMRVSMGLAIHEHDREARAIEFYNMLSSFRFVSSTPTLFNAGTCHPQLSSCYLLTVDDDLTHIFKTISDNAALSKWAGGLGNDWTNIRATGATIKGTNGESQGVIPFLKIVNDTAIAVNQGGKRKGAVCCYLETWHLDIEEFLELRKNTGDDRRRTHDMHSANWIPDLFMKRVLEAGHWTLFSPNEVPDLHDLYGKAFETRYAEYERMADEGKLRQFKRVEAVGLWKKMLSMLFETGHPWLTFKDPSNLRSPQDHQGVIHSSNLCTEILLNTSKDETAVCNLGSINLKAHVTAEGLNAEMLRETIFTAVRMLDNVIDINFYPTQEARNANLRHRPIGLGIMGFQDALLEQRLSYNCDEAIEFADASMEMISYYAILGSTELARERGAYSTYHGSKWQRGMIPYDTIALLAEQRGGHCEVDMTMRLDWTPVREAIRQHGMRNSNVMAIAPTATISNISDCTQSIEPSYRNLYVKSNLSGDFTIINEYLVNELKRLNIWDEQMIDDLKYYDGSVLEIDRIPYDLKQIYRTAFEVEPKYLIEAASRRQKWIDMGQSLNLYIAEPSGKKLNDMYMLAWRTGLKTTYYLRSMAATQIEKSGIDVNKRSIQPKWMKSKSASSRVMDQSAAEAPTEPSSDAFIEPTNASEFLGEPGSPLVCDPNNPDCESCQ